MKQLLVKLYKSSNLLLLSLLTISIMSCNGDQFPDDEKFELNLEISEYEIVFVNSISGEVMHEALRSNNNGLNKIDVHKDEELNITIIKEGYRSFDLYTYTNVKSGFNCEGPNAISICQNNLYGHNKPVKRIHLTISNTPEIDSVFCSFLNTAPNNIHHDPVNNSISITGSIRSNYEYLLVMKPKEFDNEYKIHHFKYDGIITGNDSIYLELEYDDFVTPEILSIDLGERSENWGFDIIGRRDNETFVHFANKGEFNNRKRNTIRVFTVADLDIDDYYIKGGSGNVDNGTLDFFRTVNSLPEQIILSEPEFEIVDKSHEAFNLKTGDFTDIIHTRYEYYEKGYTSRWDFFHLGRNDIKTVFPKIPSEILTDYPSLFDHIGIPGSFYARSYNIGNFQSKDFNTNFGYDLNCINNTNRLVKESF